MVLAQDENAELYLVGRNQQRLSEVVQDAKAFGNAAVHSIVVCPLASQESVAAACVSSAGSPDTSESPRKARLVLSCRQPSFSALFLLSVASIVQLSTFHTRHSPPLMNAGLGY